MSQFPEFTIDTLKESQETLHAYAWPGGYPIEYVGNDGCVFCAECATATLMRDGYEKLTGDVYWEGATIQCDDCGTDIENAYGDPSDPDDASESD